MSWRVPWASFPTKWRRRHDWCARTKRQLHDFTPKPLVLEPWQWLGRGGGGGRRGGRGGEAVDVSVEVHMVLSQDKVLQRFVEQTIDDVKVGLAEFNTASCSRTSRRKSDVGLVVPFSDVIKFARAVSLGNLYIISTSSSSGRHFPSCSCDSYGGIGKSSCVFYVKLYSDPEVVAPCALKNLDLFNERFVSGNHTPRMRQFGGFWTNSTHVLRESEL